MMYAHSKCCNAHWELVCTDEGKAELHCEECNENIGSILKLEFTKEISQECDCCKEEKKKNDKRRTNRKISQH